MSDFYVYWEQDGGCDYTIACGKDLEKLPVSSVEEAVKHAVEEHEHRFEEGSECEVVRLTILEVVGATQIDVADIKLQLFQKTVEAAHADPEAKERAEYERLRAKFGDKS